MPKFKLKKGDKLIARSPMTRDENAPYGKIGGQVEYAKPLTVKRAYDHGVSTEEHGYIHNNNIISKYTL